MYRQEHKTEALPPGRYKQLNELSVIKLLREQSFKDADFCHSWSLPLKCFLVRMWTLSMIALVLSNESDAYAAG